MSRDYEGLVKRAAMWEACAKSLESWCDSLDERAKSLESLQKTTLAAWNVAEDQVLALQAQNERLAKDAARYVGLHKLGLIGNVHPFAKKKEADAIVDAALAP